MSNPTQGSYTVVGMVTGTHIIEDIRVPVPHQVAVDIPADQAHRSRDLWIGIDQKRLFLLKGHSGATRVAPKAPLLSTPLPQISETPPKVEDAKLRAELEETRQELTRVQGKLNVALSDLVAAQKQNTRLQEDQAKKLEAIVTMLSRLEMGQVSVVEGVQEALQAVGGDTPVFIPENIQPKDAEMNIQPKEGSVLEGSSVKNAASALRGLKKKAKPGG